MPNPVEHVIISILNLKRSPALELSIRLADKNDLDIILEFSHQLAEIDPSPLSQFAFDEQRIRAALQNLIDEPSFGRVWLIREQAKPIGYVVLTLGYSLEYHGPDAILDEFFITTGHQGQGIGSKVIQFVEAACRQLGVNALHLEVERENIKAQSLYRKFGFVDHDRYLMTKRIKK